MKRCKKCKYPLPQNGKPCRCLRRHVVSETVLQMYGRRPDPTPQEIAERAEEIRAEWDAKRMSEQPFAPPEWHPPTGRYAGRS